MMIGLIILAIEKLQRTGCMGSHLPWQKPWLDDMLFVRNLILIGIRTNQSKFQSEPRQSILRAVTV